MKCIDFILKDISDFRNLIEMLSGFITELNMDCIKDVRAYEASELNGGQMKDGGQIKDGVPRQR